ncbi:tetratricopeptide repeat protein [Archangium lansingense]|uniref:Tetratricopeptide repeat protein n=1 Tax=Archangium lansingense TaxID=2995310 RepID=A0ABT3ZYU0_9BACT|nr:tetratricopeptide repeat protein [Archangium lansinium]MCY1074194.1 tetratricopeptide repeat protein [Archangium lansinium]
MTSLIHSLADRSVLPVLVAVVLAVSPLTARAANVDGGSEVESQARAKFSEGNLAYDLGEFQKALDAYSEAYRLMPLPGFLFNIAQCHRQLGRPERAGFFYRRYLTLSKEEPSNAALVKELIAEVEESVRKEQERRLTREETARDQAKAAALRAQAEATAARRVQQGEGRRTLAPRARAPGQAEAEVKGGDSLLKKWWVWAGAGAVAVIAGGVIYAATAPQPRPTTLGTVR